jgi:hypothetical protein
MEGVTIFDGLLVEDRNAIYGKTLFIEPVQIQHFFFSFG